MTTAVITRTGPDPFGRFVHKALRGSGVDIAAARRRCSTPSTLGRGHTGGTDFWTAFIAALRNAGYDALSASSTRTPPSRGVDGVAESVAALGVAWGAPAAQTVA